MIEIIGYFASFCLTVSAIPQLIETYKTKDVKGLSYLMLWLWFLGCFGMMLYIALTSCQLPLVINYLLNSVVSFTIILLYHRYN